jgi:hypothetical protein
MEITNFPSVNGWIIHEYRIRNELPGFARTGQRRKPEKRPTSPPCQYPRSRSSMMLQAPGRRPRPTDTLHPRINLNTVTLLPSITRLRTNQYINRKINVSTVRAKETQPYYTVCPPKNAQPYLCPSSVTVS